MSPTTISAVRAAAAPEVADAELEQDAVAQGERSPSEPATIAPATASTAASVSIGMPNSSFMSTPLDDGGRLFREHDLVRLAAGRRRGRS